MITAQDREERKILRQRLATMGISSSPNANLETLRKKFSEACSENNTSSNLDGNSEKSSVNTTVESAATIAERTRKEATKLIRVRIRNLNPYKQDLHGEIFTVANNVMGKVSKYIPYDEAGESYHIPNCFLNMLKSKKFVSFKKTKDPVTGKSTVAQFWSPEFSIEVLPQLTKEELEELALKQEAARKAEIF